MTKIRISLLPEALRKQSSAMKRWTIVALVLAIIAMVMLAGNILFSLYLKSPVAELESLKNENKSMTDNIGRLSYIQEMFDEIENNNQVIASLKGFDPDWPFVIDASTGELTTNGITASRVEINANGDNPGIFIKGKTSDVDNIGIWVNKVKENESVAGVKLGNISTGSGSGDQLEFHFDAIVSMAKWNKE